MTTNKNQKIRYSRGRDNYDNAPEQRTADNFDQFELAVLDDRSPSKGSTYICGPLSHGAHDRKNDYPEDAHYRLASHAQMRRILATDEDGFRDRESFEQFISDLSALRAFGYTTWSHQEDKPRCRVIFELNREVSRSEAIALGKSLERMFKNIYGDDAIKFDKSVYQNEQPVYSPGPDAKIFHFDGKPLDVDYILKKYPEPDQLKSESSEIDSESLDGNTVSNYSRLTSDSLHTVLGFIDCTSEPTWFDVANVLARVYGEGGRETFQRFSKGDFWGKPYIKHDSTEVDKKFDRSLRELEHRPSGYGVRHLIKIAGLTTDDVVFEEDHNLQVAFGATSINQMSNGSISFPILNNKKKPLQVSDNLIAVLLTYGISARYNQIFKRGEFIVPGLKCVLDESDNTSLTTVTDYAIKSGMTAARIPELLDAIASQNPFCPVQTYIDSKAWDGISRFTQFTGQIQCGNPVLADLFWRKWLIQAVAAAYEPKGIANAGMIVLTGVQNVGKTTLIKALASGIDGVFLEGQTLNPADKDSVMTAVSHWIVELGELDATFRKAEIAQLKAFVTKVSDTLRKPFTRKDSNFPRRTVFAGTVNDFQFLHDLTGNRRFWPIDVDGIVRDATIDYQQLWAEVKTWYQTGEKWYLNQQEVAMLNQYSEQFMVSDPDIEALLDKYPFTGCTTWSAELMKDICHKIDIEHPTKGQTMKLASAIRKYNGGQKPQITNKGGRHFVPDLLALKAVESDESIPGGGGTSDTSGTSYLTFLSSFKRKEG